MNHLGIVSIFLLGSLSISSCEWLGLDTPGGDEPVEAVPLTLTKAQEAYVTNGNAFAVKLLAEMDKVSEKPGYFFSPMSLSMALTMLLNGTKGEAYAELGAALGYGADFDIGLVNDYCRQFIERAPTWDPEVSVSIANALVTNQDYTIKAPFKATLQDSYNAEVSNRDFSKKATLDYINDWCKKQTRGMIPKILETLSAEDILYLINAIYFKGTWASQFKASETQDSDFFCADGSKQTVKMMHQTLSNPVRKKGSVLSLEMYYGNATFVMQIILPPLGEMGETIAIIEKDGWDSFFTDSDYVGSQADVYFPRFEQNCSFEKLPLQEVGIHRVLNGTADFSLICDRPLMINKVIHKTSIKLDEVGTEAAAITLIGMETAPSPPTIFRADHPFLYAIVERTTGAIMFLGKYGGD